LTDQDPKPQIKTAEQAMDVLRRRSQAFWARIWRETWGRRQAKFAVIVLAVLSLVALMAPLIANHRPYAMKVDNQWTFPLFKAMTATDWTLLTGMVVIVIAWLRARRRASSHSLIAKGLVMSTLALSAASLGFGIMSIPTDPKKQALIPGTWWWVGMISLAVIGVAALAWGAYLRFGGGKRGFDQPIFVRGNRQLLLGLLMTVFVGASLTTIDRPKLDTTDYQTLGHQKGNWAVFTPVPHDYKGQDSYQRNQPPMGPRLRLIPGGGSQAGADLNLTDERRNLNLGDTHNEPLTRQTLLSSLHQGKGVRKHRRSTKTDFTLVSVDGSRVRVRLARAKTLGDVVDLINKASRKNEKQVIEAKLEAPRGIVLTDHTKSSPTNWVGTDDSGADVLARIIAATRVALSIGFVSTGIGVLIGVTIGSLMGYFGKWVDIIGMRIIEMFMTIPTIFLLLTILAFFPPEWNPYMVYAMMIVIGLTSWMGAARFIRAEFFQLREMDFIVAAKACGLPLHSILFKHMLPNGVAPVLVDASFGVAAAIFIETNLSFLGFGIKPPDPSWGQMLSAAIDPSTGVFRWWLAIFPGLMIFLTVFCYNLLGDALRDAIDPYTKRQAHV